MAFGLFAEIEKNNGKLLLYFCLSSLMVECNLNQIAIDMLFCYLDPFNGVLRLILNRQVIISRFIAIKTGENR